MSTTQNRLATGKKVNSALDNPTNFFTSSSLQSRASDLNALLDSMSNGIKTLEAADNGLTSITKTLQSMKSTLQQARQDKSFQTASYTIDATTIGTAPRQEPLVLWRRSRHHGCGQHCARTSDDVAATPGSATSGDRFTGTLHWRHADDQRAPTLTIVDDTVPQASTTAIDAARITGIATSVASGAVTITNANGNVNFTGSTRRASDLASVRPTSTNYVAGVPAR